MTTDCGRQLSAPFIKWRHIDGPVMTCRNGKMHWLTWGERLRLWLGWTTIYEIERKWMHRNDDL